MIGSWEPPTIERIASVEARRLAVLPAIGLSGDLHQDLGRGALAVEITGSLNGDDLRDDFLKEVRAKFLAGDPVDFVADIVGESELEQVLVEELRLEEVAGDPDAFRYRIVLREYTEPPEPAGPADLSALDDAIGLDALSGLDLLDLPAIAVDIPNIGDLLSPVRTAAQQLRTQMTAGASSVLAKFSGLLGGP